MSNLTINYQLFENINCLPPKEYQLMLQAIEAAKKAYAPYSNFKVGVALELDNGTIVQGNNQENAAYPSGLCAERVAIFSASANYPGAAIKRLAVIALNANNEVTSAAPCGACRQVMAEYEDLAKQNMQITFMNAAKKLIILNGIDSLLPFRFGSKNLL